uniref:Envelope glycoprotein n=1 Tax=Angiostrongylus cantonensis TaxID=6313 RepID=A0A158P7D3_ANGCA
LKMEGHPSLWVGGFSGVIWFPNNLIGTIVCCCKMATCERIRKKCLIITEIYSKKSDTAAVKAEVTHDYKY